MQYKRKMAWLLFIGFITPFAGCRSSSYEGKMAVNKLTLSGILEKNDAGDAEGYINITSGSAVAVKEALGTAQHVDFLLNEANVILKQDEQVVFPQIVQPIALGKKETLRFFVSFPGASDRNDTVCIKIMNEQLSSDTVNLFLIRK